MAHTLSALYIHCVFSIRHRVKVLTPAIMPRLLPYMGGTLKGLDCIPIACGGFENHVHLLIRKKTTLAESEIAKAVKLASGDFLRDEIGLAGFHWQTGSGLFSACADRIDPLRHYVLHQEEHHRSQTFEEEYLQLLKRYEVEYDERFVFD